MIALILKGGRSDQSYANTLNPDHVVGMCLLILAVAGVLYYLIYTGYFDELLKRLIGEDEGQDIAEYAVLLAVILVIVIGTIRLIGSGANNTFSAVASSLTDGKP